MSLGAKSQIGEKYQWLFSAISIDVVALLFLLIVAGFLRFLHITEIPCGLFPDQASHGLDAVLLSKGLVLPIYGGDEGMFVYLVAITQFFFGTGVWQVFVTSAAIGTATIATTYLAIKELFGRKLAFVTSFLLAVSSWHIALSRDGFRAVLVPLLVTLLIFTLAKACKATTSKQRKILYALTAALFALGFYTYYAYVIFAATLVSLGLLYALNKRKEVGALVKENKKALGWALIIFVVVLAPIAIYIMIHPDEYFSRVGQVSIFAQSHNLWDRLTVLRHNAYATLVGIFTTGDLNWRHNASGHPFLPLILTPFFFVGVGYFLYKRGIYLISLLLALAMCVPAIMTNDGLPPHGLRLIGTIPFLFFIAAVPLSWLLNFGQKLWQILASVLFILILIIVGWQGYQNYFGEAPFQAHYYYDYRCDLTATTNYLKSIAPIKIIADDFSFDTIKYLMLPTKVDHETPEHLLQNFNNVYVQNNREIVVVSAFGKFDSQLVDLLATRYNKRIFTNQFQREDFYLFTRK